MTTPYILVLITTPSAEVGKQLAEALLEMKLAACVNIIPGVNSIYAWKGEIQNDQEALLVVKSRLDLFEDHLAPAVKALHPYDVPEIIALPILMGSKSYLDWIGEETQAN
ncbi:MAG: divalent-cation tolerance protein CutA [Anaerolineales bacterium]|nr:MAG: divalent-cation tolerance protein CutA [Anaerolineales bacterium]